MMKFPGQTRHKHFHGFTVTWLCLLLTAAVQSRDYDMQELCDTQQGSARISLEQGNYVQLDLELPAPKPPPPPSPEGAADAQTDGDDDFRCEIVIQTTHKDDGLLFYFENFDFVGSNFATVYRRVHQPWCGTTILRVWDGEFHYLDSCVGPGLRRAPPLSSYSSLGAVRLQLLPAGAVGAPARGGNDVSKAGGNAEPIKFTIIATASQKVEVTDDCPSGCCRDPYTFRCPLLDYCIDKKLTCNNITNCGPRVGYPQDENGELCAERTHVSGGGTLQRILGPSDVQRVVPMEDSTSSSKGVDQHTNMLRPLWSTGDADTPGSFGAGLGAGDAGTNGDVPQAFYTRIELVCGIVSIALFCLAGIGVLVCRFRGLPSRPWRRSRRARALDDSERSGASDDGDSSPEVARRAAAAAAREAQLPPPLYATVVGTDAAERQTQPAAGPAAPKPCSVCRAPSPASTTEAGGASNSNYAAVYSIRIDERTPSVMGGEIPPPPYETLYPKIGH